MSVSCCSRIFCVCIKYIECRLVSYCKQTAGLIFIFWNHAIFDKVFEANSCVHFSFLLCLACMRNTAKFTLCLTIGFHCLCLVSVYICILQKYGYKYMQGVLPTCTFNRNYFNKSEQNQIQQDGEVEVLLLQFPFLAAKAASKTACVFPAFKRVFLELNPSQKLAHSSTASLYAACAVHPHLSTIVMLDQI